MVKKTLAALTMLCSICTAKAQISDGYYRFQNVGTERYIVVVDNRGSVSAESQTADLGAVHTFRGFDDNIVSNPGSIIYVKKGGNGYDLRSQGMSTYDMIGYYLKVIASNKNKGAYKAYATRSGMTMYIYDAEVYDVNESQVVTNGKRNSNEEDWYVKPVTADGDNYFGITPACEINGKYYQSLYAAFPFKFYSDGMKALYVSKYGNGMAVLKEYTGETIPASMPLLIECSASEPTGNRLDLVASTTATAPSDNILTGVYFNNGFTVSHINRVKNDVATMRMLGVTSTGELGMIAMPDVNYVPANTVYLSVTEGTESELKFVSEDEFTAGISEITVDNANKGKSGIYNLSGVKVTDGTTLPNNLPHGIYIVNGKKVVF